MSAAKKRNTGHSVFQRLLNHANIHREDFNLLLLRYGVERLLYRLSISAHERYRSAKRKRMTASG